MRIDYALQIQESELDLRQHEDRLRGTSACDPVRMLRLLRSGKCNSQQEVAYLLGFSARQVRRWWLLYQQAGLNGLTACRAPGGSKSRVTDEIRAHLAHQIRTGQLSLLKEVQHYLHDVHGIEYQSLQGVWDMLQSQGLSLNGAQAKQTRLPEAGMRTSSN